MKNSKAIKCLSILAASLLTTAAYAAPFELSNAQMDTVSGGAFVCPVISTDAVLNSPKAAEPETGLYTIIGPTVGAAVPARATNDNGDGSPHGAYVSPGDTSYTAIWY